MLRFQLPSALACFMFVLVCSATSKASDDPRLNLLPARSIGLIQSLELVIDDQIDGGCWTNANEIRQKSRSILENVGIAVYLEPILDIPPFIQELRISGLGMRVPDSDCFAHLEVKITALDRKVDGAITFLNTIENHSNAIVLVNSNSLDSQVLEFVETTISSFTADFLAARKDEIIKSLNEFKGKVPVKEWSEFSTK